MAYVITAPCIADGACEDVCPVDCISPKSKSNEFDHTEQLFINPDVCINCGACVQVCPVLAIYEEGALPLKWQHYTEINRQYFKGQTHGH